MKKVKFYALLSGSKDFVSSQMERTFDKKSKKFFNKVSEVKSSRPVTSLVVLDDATTRAEAQQDAELIAKKLGVKLQGVHAFK